MGKVSTLHEEKSFYISLDRQIWKCWIPTSQINSLILSVSFRLVGTPGF